MEKKEFERLQKLSCIKLSSQEEEKLGNQLSGIIEFLSKIQEIASSTSVLPDHILQPTQGVKVFSDVDALLNNVHHPVINKSIVISSVLK